MSFSSSPRFVETYTKYYTSVAIFSKLPFLRCPFQASFFSPVRVMTRFPIYLLPFGKLPKFSCRGQHPPAYEDKKCKPAVSATGLVKIQVLFENKKLKICLLDSYSVFMG